MSARALLVALLFLAAAPGLRGQELVAHHGFPLAGSELVIVVEGFLPGAALRVDLSLAAGAPPPSLQRHLIEAFEATDLSPNGSRGSISAWGRADAQGTLTLRVPLIDPEDPGHLVALSFLDLETDASLDLRLLVQPPTVLLPVNGGLARVELLGGRHLYPDVPGPGELLGAAFSRDGLTFHGLFEGGRLQARSAQAWNGLLTSERLLDPAGERLARSNDGPAFVIARAEGSPFAPPGRLLPLDAGRSELQVDPLGQRVEGRRWAVTGDGLTAFVAEDDLLVREVDLLRWRARPPFAVGFNGDRAVVDLTLAGDVLLVASRRDHGQPGSLTAMHLDSGLVRPWPLGLDPARIVRLSADLSLVTAASGELFQLLERGVPGPVLSAGLSGDQLLDAVAVTDGALLLVKPLDGGQQLRLWSPERGLLSVASLTLPGTRLVSAGHDLALVLGAADGSVQRVIPSRGVVERVEDLLLRAGSPANPHQLP